MKPSRRQFLGGKMRAFLSGVGSVVDLFPAPLIVQDDDEALASDWAMVLGRPNVAPSLAPSEKLSGPYENVKENLTRP